MKHWKKFYVCECGGEGIMTSYEYSEKYNEKEMPIIDLAFFQQGFGGCKDLTFRDKIRWCWHILTKGDVWCDMVILDKKTAKELGRDLLKWGNNEKKAEKNKK